MEELLQPLRHCVGGSVGAGIMRIEHAPMRCMACKHEWLAETVIEAPVAVWVASVNAIRCPKCGAGPDEVAFRQIKDPRVEE
jgi:hypothetical protein